MAKYLPILLAIAPLAFAQNSTSNSSTSSTASSKRGIVYVAPAAASDNNYWTNSSDDMTWYYNYGMSPTAAFENSEMEFVPMLWGAPSSPTTDMSLYGSVQTMLKSGTNVTWALGFNEPDGCSDGGSCVDPKVAAQVWIKQMEPMRTDLGIKLGGPACTGGASGWTWLQQFHGNCSILHGNSTGCEMDFLPIHWYGNFAGLASHMGQVASTYPNISEIWITEFAYANEDLATTQDFYNSSTSYFDRLSSVGKYSYFGAFRSSVSNVGANAAFLTSNGKLTDIGSWYLGGSATGNIPTGSASGTGMFAGWIVCVSFAVGWTLL